MNGTWGIECLGVKTFCGGTAQSLYGFLIRWVYPGEGWCQAWGSLPGRSQGHVVTGSIALFLLQPYFTCQREIKHEVRRREFDTTILRRLHAEISQIQVMPLIPLTAVIMLGHLNVISILISKKKLS